MITKDEILEATNGGLDIILGLYPQAKSCSEGKAKAFKLRNENTPSATMRKKGDVWQVTDFGDDGHAKNAIDLYMEYHNISRFGEAIIRLAQEYGIDDNISKERNKPKMYVREPKQGEKEGVMSFETKEFSDGELKVLGPHVNKDHVESLGWLSLKWRASVDSERKCHVKESTDTYPIFARECYWKDNDGNERVFYKIYEPLNPDKGFRFQYSPKGGKPQKYINGLNELKKAWTDFNEKERRVWESSHDDDEPYKEQKLPEAFICSGERDSLCCRSMGYHPLWFNSETYTLSEEEYREIMKYVEVLYNIPDIDETGVRRGIEMALKYIDIHTVWLPEWLKTYKDRRGKFRKDLRDWMELRDKRSDFRNILTQAYPAKFWVTTTNNKTGKTSHSIDTACLFYFLRINGFYALHDENSQTTQFVKVTGRIVKKTIPKEMREFVRRWVEDRYESRDVLNLVLDSTKLTQSTLEGLQEIDPDFTTFTEHKQFFFFPNGVAEVSPEKISFSREGTGLNNFVWDKNIIDHNFKLKDDMFSISRIKKEDGSETWDIEIKDALSSHFFGYLINSSRLFWRKELEKAWQDADDDERKAYSIEHRFDIAGNGLTEDEIAAQKQCLINKIFVFGYMLHHYKSPSRAWAPMAMDNKIGDFDECNGRSGKSFFFKTLSLLQRTVKLSGRNPKLMDNPHVFDQVTQHTQMLLLDDCDRYLNTGLFYDNITSDMTVNPKNNQSFTIPFEQSPKIAFTTNYVPADFDPSSEARLIYMVFSDYYHQKTEDNDYLETRSIRDDFGKDLYSRDYSEDEWLADLNFFLQCCRFYLSLTNELVKILPPMDNIIQRKWKFDMGEAMYEWANAYFSEGSGNLDKLIPRARALEDFKSQTGQYKTTSQSFSRRLKAFAEQCDYIDSLNPSDLQNSGGRIVRKHRELPTEEEKAVDMIYMRSKREAEQLAKKNGNGKPIATDFIDGEIF